MAKLRDELKAKLIDAGVWGEFVAYRGELVAGGMAPADALRAAVGKFIADAPEAVAQPRPGQRRSKAKAKAKRSEVMDGSRGQDRVGEDGVVGGVRAGAALAEVAAGSGGEAVAARGDREGCDVASVRVGVTGGLGAAPLAGCCLEDFGGRTASEVEIIRWVARNMEVADPRLSECPDPTAWALLSHCRRSLMAAGEFWKQTYTKLLPSRAQLEQVEDDADDSGVTLETLEKIREARVRAMEVA
jgi:hypothetical protein